jgi:hypothetical protein
MKSSPDHNQSFILSHIIRIWLLELLSVGLYNKTFYTCNEEKSGASFCRQVTALFPDMFCNFYLAKNHKFSKNSTTTNAREKKGMDLECLEL